MPPQREDDLGRLRVLPMQLVGTVGPAAQLCLVSQHITFRYRFRSAHIRFPLGASNLVRVYPFLSLDDSAPTTERPAGTPLFAWLSANPYLVGDNCEVEFPIDLPVTVRGTWIKAHIVNTDVFAHTITALFTIQEQEGP